MSTQEALCDCKLIVTNDIRLCAKCHSYYRGTRQYTSVSKVIKTLMPDTYSGIDPVVLETARLRGVFVDQYVSDWLRDPTDIAPLDDVAAMVAPLFPRDGEKYAQDVVRRIDRVINWWQRSGLKAEDVQRMVWSDRDGVAGTFDIGTDAMILDLKNVASLSPSYQLQLGGYLSYDKAETCRDPAVLHVTKDGIRLVEYDANACIEAWTAAITWFNTLKALNNGNGK